MVKLSMLCQGDGSKSTSIGSEYFSNLQINTDLRREYVRLSEGKMGAGGLKTRNNENSI